MGGFGLGKIVIMVIALVVTVWMTQAVMGGLLGVNDINNSTLATVFNQTGANGMTPAETFKPITDMWLTTTPLLMVVPIAVVGWYLLRIVAGGGYEDTPSPVVQTSYTPVPERKRVRRTRKIFDEKPAVKCDYCRGGTLIHVIEEKDWHNCPNCGAPFIFDEKHIYKMRFFVRFEDYWAYEDEPEESHEEHCPSCLSANFYVRKDGEARCRNCGDTWTIKEEEDDPMPYLKWGKEGAWT